MGDRQITLEELAKHNTPEDCWIAVHGKVFDVTKFASEHPGGKKVLHNVAGKEATDKFDQFHKLDVLKQYGPALIVGELAKSGPVAPREISASAPPKTSAMGTAVVKKPAPVDPNSFGEMVPYGDPSWYQGWVTPYYNDSHRRYRAAVREFIEKEVTPFCHEWDEAKKVPRELHHKFFKAGILPASVGAPWPTEYAGTNIAGGVKPEEFDYFHELIMIDELCRPGSGGVGAAIMTGLAIGLPPVYHFGSKMLKDKVCGPCLRGEKIICLAITEPYAGSDVANIRCEAKLTPDGKHFIVNGEKKWITNGVFADFFTVAVRTGGPGMNGISLLLIERSMPGITTRQMQCTGLWASGTTYITFEDVKVPVEHIIGKQNEGFKYIMANFNHERWGIVVQGVRFARVCLEESIKYAHKRKTFGQRLIDHPVIRQKLAHMARHVEATQSWLESITHQMTKMPFKEQAVKLGGPIALMKAQATLTFELCAREAAQVFGGLSYSRGGQGEKIERLYREVRGLAIPGGSEEIMLDLGIRQALRRAKL